MFRLIFILIQLLVSCCGLPLLVFTLRLICSDGPKIVVFQEFRFTLTANTDNLRDACDDEVLKKLVQRMVRVAPKVISDALLHNNLQTIGKIVVDFADSVKAQECGPRRGRPTGNKTYTTTIGPSLAMIFMSRRTFISLTPR